MLVPPLAGPKFIKLGALSKSFVSGGTKRASLRSNDTDVVVWEFTASTNARSTTRRQIEWRG